MSYCEAKIRWQDIKHRHYTGGLIVTLPENTNPFDFIGGSRDNLPEIIGCEKCPMYKTTPTYAEDYWIRPQIGDRYEQNQLDGNNLPIVEIICEGTDKAAGEKATCPKSFKKEQTKIVELYDRS